MVGNCAGCRGLLCGGLVAECLDALAVRDFDAVVETHACCYILAAQAVPGCSEAEPEAVVISGQFKFDQIFHAGVACALLAEADDLLYLRRFVAGHAEERQETPEHTSDEVHF